jgi:NCS1 family nucleobase:cation symporter-1
MCLEKQGIEHIEEKQRHGAPFNTFTLWFGANLTIADYALGSLFYHLPFTSIIMAVVIGNVLGGLLVGLMASMGPTFGYPQMMISRAVVGRLGNAPFALANWLSTVGWFTVNIILGGYALGLAFNLPFYIAAGLMVIADVVIALFGHDVIHLFEKVMSIVLAAMFTIVTIVAFGSFRVVFPSYEAQASLDPYFWALVVAAIFSYLMSWSPYASDYSRYLPKGTSKGKIVAYSMAGGAVASAWLEIIGFIVYLGANNQNLNTIQALASVSGGFAIFALLAVVLGALAADALNLYTNSLSALVLYRKAGRAPTVLVAGVVGFTLAILGSVNFGSFYQNFLLTLDYWITPWIGIMIGAFFVKRVRSGVEGARPYIWPGLAAYAVGLLASLPFMNLTSYGVAYVGPMAALLQGADVSYFVAFAVAFVAYVVIAPQSRSAVGK